MCDKDSVRIFDTNSNDMAACQPVVVLRNGVFGALFATRNKASEWIADQPTMFYGEDIAWTIVGA